MGSTPDVAHVLDPVLHNERQLLGHAQSDLVGQGRCLGKGVEIAQRKAQRHRFLQIDHSGVLRLVHICVLPAYVKAGDSVKVLRQAQF